MIPMWFHWNDQTRQIYLGSSAVKFRSDKIIITSNLGVSKLHFGGKMSYRLVNRGIKTVPLHNDTHVVPLKWSNKTDLLLLICAKIWLLSYIFWDELLKYVSIIFTMCTSTFNHRNEQNYIRVAIWKLKPLWNCVLCTAIQLFCSVQNITVTS